MVVHQDPTRWHDTRNTRGIAWVRHLHGISFHTATASSVDEPTPRTRVRIAFHAAQSTSCGGDVRVRRSTHMDYDTMADAIIARIPPLPPLREQAGSGGASTWWRTPADSGCPTTYVQT